MYICFEIYYLLSTSNSLTIDVYVYCICCTWHTFKISRIISL